MTNFFIITCQIVTLALPITTSGLILIMFLKKKWLTTWHYPIDLGKTLHGVRIFGDNKTFLGVVTHLTVCTLVCYFLACLLNCGDKAEFFIHPLFHHSFFLLGIIFGGSYVVGELINSFIKRRLKINSGQNTKSLCQYFFDLNDGPIMMITILCLLQWLSIRDGILLFLLGWLIHSLTDFFMYKLRLK